MSDSSEVRRHADPRVPRVCEKARLWISTAALTVGVDVSERARCPSSELTHRLEVLIEARCQVESEVLDLSGEWMSIPATVPGDAQSVVEPPLW